MIVQHIWLGDSRERSWCGLYVGFHKPLPAMVESDYIARKAKGLGATTCHNCARSYDANNQPRRAR